MINSAFLCNLNQCFGSRNCWDKKCKQGC